MSFPNGFGFETADVRSVGPNGGLLFIAFLGGGAVGGFVGFVFFSSFLNIAMMTILTLVSGGAAAWVASGVLIRLRQKRDAQANRNAAAIREADTQRQIAEMQRKNSRVPKVKR